MNEEGHFDNLFQIATRVFHLSVDKWSQEWSKRVDLLFQPPGVEKHDILRTKHIDKLYREAYEYARDVLG